jgi:tRNA-Thr(GGU) m(6)t(6)A37 methyltransferase TsaA
VQSSLNPDEVGRVELVAGFADGLLELAGFDFAWLLTWLGSVVEDRPPAGLRQVPFLLGGQGRQVGVFAMRGPHRPNPIGLHLVRVLDVTDTGFSFGGLDMVDATPVLDIKPWVAPLDLPPTGSLDAVRSGWFDGVDLSGSPTPSSLSLGHPPPE